MRDDLLARADRAIRESQLLRESAHQDRFNARVAVIQARATVRLARAEGERSVSLYRDGKSGCRGREKQTDKMPFATDFEHRAQSDAEH
jgi:hypothetical protein